MEGPFVMMRSSKFIFVPILLVALCLGGCSREARKTRLLEQAEKDFRAEQFDKAEIGYLNVLRISSGDTVALRQLGTIYFTEGRVLEAYRLLQRTAEVEPENTDAQLRLGMAYLTFRKTKEARAQAEKVLARRQGDEEALLLLAESASSSREAKQIQEQIEQLRKADRPRVGYHLASAALFLRQKELGEAEREIKSAQALELNSGSVQFALGTLHQARGNFDEAEKAFRLAAQTAPLRSPRRIKLAEFLLSRGKIADAKLVLEEITRRTPDYFPAWSVLIQVAFVEKRFDDCAALVEKVLSRDPANFDALRNSASLKMVKGDYAGGIEQFERINKVYQRVPEILFQLGRAYFLTSDVPKAMKNLNLALATDPDFAPAILLLSEIQIRQGDTLSAIPRLEQLVRSHPRIAQAQLLLASAYLQQQKTEEALEVYRRMTSLFPNDPQPLLLAGIALNSSGKRAAARKFFEKALDLKSDYLPAIERLVELDISEKAYPSAIDRVRKQMEKNASAELWILMATIQLAQKDSANAEISLEKALALNPESRIAYTLLAKLYADSNRQEEALRKLSEVSSKTNSVSVLMQIGMIHGQLNHFTAARDSYEKILSIKPDFSPALNNLAYLYSEHLDKLDSAYEMAQKARQLLPFDPAAADTLGWILYKKQNYPRALALLQESASKLSDVAEVQFHLGMTYYMLGEEEKALAALETASRSKDEFPGKSDMASRLSVLRIVARNANATEIAFLEKTLDENPRDPVASARLADIYENKGEFKTAAKICENALKQNPSNAQLMVRLAGLYARHFEDHSKAMELATEAHNVAPENPHISQFLGGLAYEAKDYNWALSLAQDAARRLPDKVDLNFDLARGYFAVGQLAEAEIAMRKVVKAGGSFDGANEAKRFLAMLDLYNNPSKVKAALAEATQILKTEPDYIPALMVSSVAFEQSGNLQEARNQQEKILEVNPLFTPAYRDLARLNAKAGINDGRAYEVAVKAREAFPDNPEVAKILGILVYGRKDYSRAAQLLDESSRRKSEDADLFYYLGMTYYQLKKAEESRQALKRALALNLPAQLAEEANRTLVEIR